MPSPNPSWFIWGSSLSCLHSWPQKLPFCTEFPITSRASLHKTLTKLDSPFYRRTVRNQLKEGEGCRILGDRSQYHAYLNNIVLVKLHTILCVYIDMRHQGGLCHESLEKQQRHAKGCETGSTLQGRLQPPITWLMREKLSRNKADDDESQPCTRPSRDPSLKS